MRYGRVGWGLRRGCSPGGALAYWSASIRSYTFARGHLARKLPESVGSLRQNRLIALAEQGLAAKTLQSADVPYQAGNTAVGEYVTTTDSIFRGNGACSTCQDTVGPGTVQSSVALSGTALGHVKTQRGAKSKKISGPGREHVFRLGNRSWGGLCHGSAFTACLIAKALYQGRDTGRQTTTTMRRCSRS